jgi:hypothetical protein
MCHCILLVTISVESGEPDEAGFELNPAFQILPILLILPKKSSFDRSIFPEIPVFSYPNSVFFHKKAGYRKKILKKKQLNYNRKSSCKSRYYLSYCEAKHKIKSSTNEKNIWPFEIFYNFEGLKISLNV